MFISVIVVFIIGMIIDIIRKMTYDKLVDKIYNYINKKIQQSNLHKKVQDYLLKSEQIKEEIKI